MAANPKIKLIAAGFLAFGVWAVGTAVMKIALEDKVSVVVSAALVAGIELVVAAGIAMKIRAGRPRPMPIHPEPPPPVEDPISKALHGGLDHSRPLADQTGFFKAPPVDDSNPGAGRMGVRAGAPKPNYPKEESTSGEPIRF